MLGTESLLHYKSSRGFHLKVPNTETKTHTHTKHVKIRVGSCCLNSSLTLSEIHSTNALIYFKTLHTGFFPVRILVISMRVNVDPCSHSDSRNYH